MMIDRLMPYVNKVTNLVPGFGQKEAAIFTGALLTESFVRALKRDSAIKILFLDSLKHIQFYASFAKYPFYSHSFSHKFKTHLALLPSNILGIAAIFNITGMEKCNTKSKKKYHATLEADRPPLVSFVACAGEALKIGAKIVGSLATGVVAEKMATGQTEGKIRFAVSAALLTLSAWNVKAVVD